MGRIKDLHILAFSQNDGILLRPQGQVVSCDHVDVKDLIGQREEMSWGGGSVWQTQPISTLVATREGKMGSLPKPWGRG